MNQPQISPAAEEEQGGHVLVVIAMAIAAFIIGCTIGLFASGDWISGIAASVSGSEPTAFWYVSRSMAFVAYILLWVSMVLGLSITNKLARLWPGGPAATDLHQYASFLGLAFGCGHALMLLGDQYIGYTFSQIAIPFNSTPYHLLSVGLGQVALYLGVAVALSFYVRRWITYRVWRTLHYASFAVFGLALFHGLLSGTDSTSPVVQWMYIITGLSVVGLTLRRIIAHPRKPAGEAQERRAAVNRPA